MNIGSEFLQSAVKRLNYYKELGDKTFAQLTENDFHYQPNEASNSIAIIIQHMAGNMLSRWTDLLTTALTVKGRAVLFFWIEGNEINKIERTWLNTHIQHEGCLPVLNKVYSPTQT